MRRVLLALTALSAMASITTSAHAADGAVNWNGPYVGLNAGWGWSDDNGSPFCVNPGGVLNGTGCVTNLVPGGHLRSDGFVGGGQLGYNWQSGPMVYGLETDFQGSDLNGSTSTAISPSIGGPGTFSASERLNWFGTVRPRIGYAGFNPVLIYATGGLAYGEVKVTQDTAFSSLSYPGSKTEVKIGWTAGAGVEWAFSRNLSAKLEGDYFDLGSISDSAGSTPPPVTGYLGGKNFTLQGALVRVGLNFRFPPPPPPPPAMAPPPPAPQPAAAPAPAPAPAPRLFIVFFDFDKYNLTPDARKVVEEAASTYKSGGSAKVTLAGYTDLSGPAGYNMKLSERRAKAVAAAMVKLGVPESAMDVSWHGKENPRVPTPDGVREPQNRRVEISE